MSQYKTRFSIQDHWQKKPNASHYDLRILNPRETTLWSWAFVKHKFPRVGERVLAIRTANHRVSYMYFHGVLQNGDKVEVYDRGKCRIIMFTENLIIVNFNGNKIKGTFNFIKLADSDDAWIVTQSKQPRM